MAGHPFAFVTGFKYSATESSLVVSFVVITASTITDVFEIPVPASSPFGDAGALSQDVLEAVVGYSDANNLGLETTEYVYLHNFLPTYLLNFSNLPTAGVADGPADAPTDAPTNAPADAPTNYNILTATIGILADALNASNAKQNEVAAKLNETAAKLNEVAAKLNIVSASHNELLARQRNIGLIDN